MTPRATPKPPEAPTEPAVDPLADLRDPDEVGLEPDTPEETHEMATVDPEEWDRRRDLAVLAMHSDLTSVGFLHRGHCGCRYVAGVMLRAVLPVQADETEEE